MDPALRRSLPNILEEAASTEASSGGPRRARYDSTSPGRVVVSIRALLLYSILLPSLPVCFFRPFYGIVLWTIVAFASPQWYAWGAAYEFPIAVAIAIPTLAGALIFARKWNRLISSEALLLVLLLSWFTLTSIVASNTPLFQDHVLEMWARWQVVLKISLMALVTIVVVDTKARIRTLFIVIAACFSFYVLKALPLMITGGLTFRLYGPPKSMVEDNNDLGLALNMTVPILFFLAQTEVRTWLRRVFWGLLLVMVPGIFCTYSRGALVGLIAVVGVLFFQLKQRLLLIPLILLGVMVAVLVAPASWRERMDPTREGALDNSALSRLNSWTFAWRLATDYPITGGGFETFTPELFARYATNSSDVHGPHSIYFGVLADHGFVGLGLYLGLLLSCFYTAHRIIRWAQWHGDEEVGSYARLCQLSLVGFLTSGLFLGRAYFDYFFTIVACLVILKGVSVSAREATEWNGESMAEQMVWPSGVVVRSSEL
jgi:probable O-glycosylation ligase (exosortase A-associated)